MVKKYTFSARPPRGFFTGFAFARGFGLGGFFGFADFLDVRMSTV
jgi:hypothetical protein